MFVINAYRWAIKRLHSAILTAAQVKRKEAKAAHLAALAMIDKHVALDIEAATLEAEAARIKPLLG